MVLHSESETPPEALKLLQAQGGQSDPLGLETAQADAMRGSRNIGLSPWALVSFLPALLLAIVYFLDNKATGSTAGQCSSWFTLILMVCILGLNIYVFTNL